MKGEQDMMAYYDKRFTESLSGLKCLEKQKKQQMNIEQEKLLGQNNNV